MYTVYSKSDCPNCQTVKTVMSMNGITFEEKEVGKDITIEEFTSIAPGIREMPQVFKGGQRIGGLNDFKAHLIILKADHN